MILGNIKLIVKRLRQAMAIVEEGDTASQSIAKDKYVMWKGILCKTDSAITQGGTFATSGAGKNLTAKTEGLGGEIATLNSNITTLSEHLENLAKVSSDTSISGIKCVKQGSVVTIMISKNSVTIAANGTIATIPSGYRPSQDIQIYDGLNDKALYIQPDGKLIARGALSSTNLRATVTYIV